MIPNEILNYRVIRQIGSGGMGQVYLAQNRDINQLVAIKSLHPQYANNAALRARFKQEAEMLSSLNHPNIVKFLNYVENANGVFLIMEYVEGDTLEDFINKKNGLIVEKRAYPMMCEILDAFSYAHHRGIVHRDIKPSNIFLNKDGQIKVMDFGIAQILSETGDDSSKQRMGTPEYMSPEQVYGHTVDQRSDIYSLGILFHQMLTGRAPYDSTTLSELEIKRRVISDPLPRLKTYYPYISEGLQKVVDKATDKDPKHRYTNCEEMKKAIKNVLAPERKNRLVLYGAIALALILAAVGIGIWDYYRTKVYYYKDYAEYFGVPKGIGELSSSEMSHRAASYRMEYSRHKLRRLTRVNSKGKAIPHSDTEQAANRQTDVYYYYTDNGDIDYKKVYNEYGKLLYKLDYDENLKTATFKYDDEYGTAMRLPLNTTELYGVDRNSGNFDRSCISRYLLSYNEDGLLKELRYAGGENNNRVGDANNIYGMAYGYDDEGRIVTIKFLGHEGQVCGNKIGLAIKKYTYDDDDNWTSVSYYTTAGTPSHDGNNCARVSYTFDDYGNVLSESYTTIDGNPVLRKDAAVFGLKYEYNDDGFRVKQISIDSKGMPMINKRGYAIVTTDYDDNGFISGQQYLDADEKATNYIEDGDAYYASKIKCNDVGLLLEASYYDTEGNPINLSSGASQYVCDYDSVGNLLQCKFYDKDGNVARINGFFSSYAITYDEFYRETTRRFYDADGKLTDRGDGVCGYDVNYDAHGNVFRYFFVGNDGKTPARCNEGYAYIVYKYDDIGNNLSIEYCDEKGGNCLNNNGYHRVETVYDTKTNRPKEEQYYGLSTLLYSEHYEYDDNGNIVKDYTLNASGQLVAGTVVENYRYGDNNNLIKNWATNKKGTIVNFPQRQYAQACFDYDDRGNVIKTTYLSTTGKPAADENGTHIRIHEYNDANLKVYEKNLGKDGKPLHGAGANPEGRVTYDDRGNMTNVMCYDGYGHPRLGSDGYHKVAATFDDHNRLISYTYTDTKGHLVCSKADGVAKVDFAYDKKGNQVSKKCYDAQGTFKSEERTTYNYRNQPTNWYNCDSHGRQVNNAYGYSRIEVVYAANGVTPYYRCFYDASGRKLAQQNYNKRTNEWG